MRQLFSKEKYKDSELTHNAIYSLSVKNNADKPETVNLFSLAVPVPEGVTIQCSETSYQHILNTIASRPFIFDRFYMTANSIIEFIDCVTHMVRKRDGRMESRPLFPLLHFDLFQMQSNIVDIVSDEPFLIDGDGEMELYLAPKQEIGIRIFVSAVINGSIDRAKVHELIGKKNEPAGKGIYSKTILPVVIENTTNEYREVRLFDYMPYITDSDIEQSSEVVIGNGVKISTPKGFISYKEILYDLANRYKCKIPNLYSNANCVKMFSTLPNHLEIAVRNIGQDERLYIMRSHVSPYQTICRIVEIGNFKYDYQPASEMIANVGPNSKSLLLFFEI